MGSSESHDVGVRVGGRSVHVAGATHQQLLLTHSHAKQHKPRRYAETEREYVHCTEREKGGDRQTNRQTEKDRDRQTERDRIRQTEKERETHRHTDRLTDNVYHVL